MDKKLENLIAASYLSGAAEALKKSKEFTPEKLEENIEDIRILRRKFLALSESDGYLQPAHHIQEAKIHALEKLKQLKQPTNSGSTLASTAPESIKNATVPTSATNMMAATKMNSPPSSSSQSPSMLNSITKSMASLTSMFKSAPSPSPSSPSLPSPSLPSPSLPLPSSSEHKNISTLPPVVQLGGKRYRKKKTLRKRR